MIIKTLRTINGSLQVSIPAGLNELQLGQLIAMQASESLTDLQAIHILSGVPLQDLQQVKNYADLEVFNEHVMLLAAQIRDLYNSDDVPGHVTFSIDEKPCRVKVIKNLSVEPAGAFMAARDIIADEINKHIARYGDTDWQQSFNPPLHTCSQILAHYFYCRVTGQPYDEELATQFTNQVEKLPVTEALPIAKYFFLSYPNLSKPRTGCWHRLCRLWSKGPVSASSKNSGTSIPLTRLLAAI